MDFKINEKIVKEFVKERFVQKFNSKEFEKAWKTYKELKPFKVNENIFDKFGSEAIDEKTHYILRLVTQFFLTKTFEAMKIDLNDPNVYEDLDTGNIGTPGRVAKMWCGSNLNDDRELMGGRFHKPVRLARFPNNMQQENDNIKRPIIKEIDLVAVCSHHLAPFGTLVSSNPNAKVVVAYIPGKFVLGISKLQRVVRYISQRGWLQEDLTKAIYNEISKAANTDSVYVKLKNIEHSCEKYRGAMTQGDGFTTEYYGGEFNFSQALLDTVRSY